MNDQLMKEIPCPLPDVRERALSIGSSTDGAIGEVECGKLSTSTISVAMMVRANISFVEQIID